MQNIYIEPPPKKKSTFEKYHVSGADPVGISTIILLILSFFLKSGLASEYNKTWSKEII